MSDPVGQAIDPGELSAGEVMGDEIAVTIFDIFAKTRLVIGTNVLAIEARRPMPNRWVRFWHRFLLGWRWEAIVQPDEKAE